MTTYLYRAVDGAGEIIDGRLDARSELEAAEQVRELGLTPLHAAVADGSRTHRFLSFEFPSLRRGLTPRDVTALTRELALLLAAGIDLEKALTIIESGSKRKKYSHVVRSVLDRVRNGSTLAEALSGSGNDFSELYISMVRGGEASGALNETFASLAGYLEESQKVAEEVRSACIYPVILLISATISVVFLIGFVLPRFRPLFDNAGDKIPVVTRLVMEGGAALETYWWLIAAAILGISLLLRAVIRTPGGRQWCDRMLLDLPMAGDIIANLETARWARTLGTLINGGVALIAALQSACATISNSVYRAGVERTLDAIKQGQPISTELESIGRFPDLARQLIRLGEETGELGPMLLKTAAIYETEVQRTIRRLLSVLTPAVTMALGLIVGGIIAAMMVAILSINSLVL